MKKNGREKGRGEEKGERGEWRRERGDRGEEKRGRIRIEETRERGEKRVRNREIKRVRKGCKG